MKKYDSNSIYFGNIIYNTDEGYYFAPNHVYEKINEDIYQVVGKSQKYQIFTTNTERLITCSDLFPLSAFLNEGEPKMLTVPMIELYKLKYMVLKSANKLPKDVVVAPCETVVKSNDFGNKTK